VHPIPAVILFFSAKVKNGDPLRVSNEIDGLLATYKMGGIAFFYHILWFDWQCSKNTQDFAVCIAMIFFQRHAILRGKMTTHLQILGVLLRQAVQLLLQRDVLLRLVDSPGAPDSAA